MLVWLNTTTSHFRFCVSFGLSLCIILTGSVCPPDYKQCEETLKGLMLQENFLTEVSFTVTNCAGYA